MSNQTIDDSFLTPQEHGLRGSSVPEKYHRFPYRPLYLQDRKHTIAECDAERQKWGKTSCYPMYWQVPQFTGEMSLEPLDLVIGDAKLDPCLISVEDFEMPTEAEFPFPRDGPVIEIGRV
jgi:hypothetical protein